MPSPMVQMSEVSLPSARMEMLAALDLQPGGFESSSDQPAPPAQALPAPRRPEVPARPRSERNRNLNLGATGADLSLANLV